MRVAPIKTEKSLLNCHLLRFFGLIEVVDAHLNVINYRSMNTNSANKLKALYAGLKPGRPVNSAELHKLDISRDLLVYYVKAGWLKRLANGVYMKPNTELDLNASLALLQKKVKGLHIGGKSALELYGLRHYMSNAPTTHLYAWDSARLPEWLTSKFRCELQRKRLLDEPPEQPLYVSYFHDKQDGPLVSEPERAALEMLSEVPTDQSLSEAEEILEAAFSLRSDVMSDLLYKCKSVKTVRLFLNLASKLSLPVYEELKEQRFPVGSNSPWVYRTGGKTLVLKP